MENERPVGAGPVLVKG